ncbi:Amino acid permease [Thalictrum thalictroides]|uniref:Amino acid permease n=1 Tax=Thalictrum thalictroides TaxID=46969 RepID=A0A7J6VTA0_THATH|nr:Amino acid permease [Thalictrum thalictroides]
MEMEMDSVEGGGRVHVDAAASSAAKEDGKARQGTLWTATAHCITAVIGSGVLALSWSVAQLGWILGPIALIAFASITYYTSILLTDCYRSPEPINGIRNPTYMAAVKSYLGPKHVLLCCIAQYTSLWGSMVSYTITSVTSMREIVRSECNHKHEIAGCSLSGNSFMVMFGAISILLAQIPNLEELTWLSVMAAVMSFGYSIISLGLSIAKWISHGDIRGSLMGVVSRKDMSISSASKTWGIFQALGNIAFAYTYAEVLIEIQDTLKSPPSENVTMKKATFNGSVITSIFYIAIGCIGYAAFGNNAPGNILTGFNEPFWLVDIANAFIIIHLVGAYQVFAQPIFAFFEDSIVSKWPENTFFQTGWTIRVPFTKSRSLSIIPAKIILRSVFIIFTTIVSMLFPFFNEILGLLGAASFWPLTVYFPITMHLSQRKIARGAPRWFLLQGLSLVCLVVCFAAMTGSVVGLIDSLRHAKLFHIEY